MAEWPGVERTPAATAPRLAWLAERFDVLHPGWDVNRRAQAIADASLAIGLLCDPRTPGSAQMLEEIDRRRAKAEAGR